MKPMATFFLTTEQIEENEIHLEGALHHHLANVLRLQVGDAVHCSDGKSICIDGCIAAIDKKEIVITVEQRTSLTGEPPCFVALIQCLPRGDKMELIVRQTTELGVGEIIPVVSDHSQIHLKKGKGAEKARRWQKVAAAAAEQCGRGKIPEVFPPSSLEEALNILADDVCIVFCYEKENAVGLNDALSHAKGKSVALLIGPEGGFSQREADIIAARGGISVTMGPRILRTETAGTAALAAVMYELGDWRGMLEN